MRLDVRRYARSQSVCEVTIKPMSLEDSGLAEWDVIEPLVDQHFDREIERVTAAWQSRARFRRSHHSDRRTSAASLEELVADLDYVDHLGELAAIARPLLLGAYRRRRRRRPRRTPRSTDFAIAPPVNISPSSRNGAVMQV